MDLPLKEMIDELGLQKLAAAADIPFSTLWRWSQKGIPGRAVEQEFRAQQIKRAARKLKAEKARAA